MPWTTEACYLFYLGSPDGDFLGEETLSPGLAGREDESEVQGWTIDDFRQHNLFRKPLPTAEELREQFREKYEAGTLRMPPGFRFFDIIEQACVCIVVHRLGAGGKVIHEEEPVMLAAP